MSKTIPCVKIEGQISSTKANLDAIKKELDYCFQKKNEFNVVFIRISSPGGSPALSSELYQYIKHQKSVYNKKVIGFATEYVASGAYYIACAFDELYVDPNTIVGSIGVVSQWFGFKPVREKIGVQYKKFTRGEQKSRLDSMDELTTDDEEWIKDVQNTIYQTFKETVKSHRDVSDDVCNGEVYIGQNAVDVGLADGISMPEIYAYNLSDRAKVKHCKKKSMLSSMFNVSSESIESVLTNIFFNVIEDGIRLK